MSYVRYIGISLGVAVSAMFFVVWAQPVAAAPTCVGFSGSLTSVCTLTAQAIDPEGDQVYYVYSWGDGSADTRMPASGFVASGTQVSADHTWNTAGSWTIRVYAYDEANHQSTASDPVLVTITSAVLSASLSGTPSSSGWYNYATFDYTTGCAANSGQTLSYCRTQVSINSGSWNNVPGGNPSTTGQSTYTYNGSYTFATNGASYRFRSTADDTGASPVVFSATVPSSGQIQVDQSFPFAAASSPPGNQSSSFIVSATLVDYPIPAPGVGNSGVSTWDLQYRANSSGAWTNCRTSIVAGQTSLNFGSGCSPAVTLVANTTYCFRARARDSTSPTQNESSYTAAANGDSCTPYQVNAAPYMPSNPNPVSAASTLAPANTNLSWDGGDPEGGSDTVTYSVYTGTTNPPSVLNGTQVAFGNQTPITYNPLSNFLAGSQYYWRVVAQDAASNITTGPVWTFTVNTAPSVTNVSIVPNGATPVNTTATITWNATDPNSSQSLGFSVYYGPSSGSLATLIASGLTPASAGCSGSPNNYTNCTYTWSSSCAPEISTAQYVTVVASDGLNSGLGSSVSTFTINHTETKYYPTSGFNTANDSDTVNFTIDAGSIESGSSMIEFRGATCSGTTTNPAADANAVGNPASYSGNLNSGVSSGDIPLLDLLPGQNNSLSFSVQGCGVTQYRVHYNLVAACNQPYLSVEQGSIYSQGNIKAQYAPPSGSYNATYFILGGGTSAQPTVIENFVAAPAPAGLTPVNPSFGQLAYPSAGGCSSPPCAPQVSSFDYYGLTHTLAGIEVVNNGTNSYGHTVSVFTNVGGRDLSEVVRDPPAALAGRVYWVKDNLRVSQLTELVNGTGGTSGGGLIIVDGDLTINSDLSYQVVAPGLSARNLASVGWLVMGNVTIAPTVGQVVGSFFVAGTGSGGTFSTGAGSAQLSIYGAAIARQFLFQRTSSPGGAPSERVVADGRVLLNTPPGFSDILHTLPTWQFRTP